MPAIRRRYHYANLIMCPTVFGGAKALCGQTVDVLNEGGETDSLHFDGFVAWNDVRENQFCLAKNIVGYTPECAPFVGNWLSYHRDDLILGTKQSNRIKVVVKNDQLVVAGRFANVKKENDAMVINLFSDK